MTLNKVFAVLPWNLVTKEQRMLLSVPGRGNIPVRFAVHISLVHLDYLLFFAYQRESLIVGVVTCQLRQSQTSTYNISISLALGLA